MPTFGFVIDNRKCIGCHACTVACKSEHEVPLGVDRTWVKYVEKGTFPNNRRLFTVMRCNHCADAPCVTICPVTSLYQRDDGVVDFNSDRCIGCKACLQACPYDALHIDPESNTAAKCNFCTHRLEVGLEPSCVIVCPVEAIIAGDIADPSSEISRLIDRHPVQVRKPEKGTQPKLFYIEADEASLVPSRTAADGQYMWSSTPATSVDGQDDHGFDLFSALKNGVSKNGSSHEPRRVYDVRPRSEAWGWQVAAYTWSKSVAAGAFLAVPLSRLVSGTTMDRSTSLVLGAVAILFLILTSILLVADLKQPKRFLYVILRPQWNSWLVRGAYILGGYGLLLVLWLGATAAGATTAAQALMWPGVPLAVLAAVYTAFLFSQAKGRDFWQNPLLPVHLLTHALVAGSAVWLTVNVLQGSAGSETARIVAGVAILFSLITILGEILTVPPTNDARAAMDMIVGQPFGRWFWLGGIALGHLAPLLLLVTLDGWTDLFAAGMALAGLYVIERLWILAPQRIPLS